MESEFEEPEEPLHRGKVILLGAIIESATGEHLERIERAANYEIELDGSSLYWAACEGRTVLHDEFFNGELTVDLHADDIDLRENVPEQVARQLVAWSKQLLSLAAEVAKVPGQKLIREPRAHNIVDTNSGEITEAGPFYESAQAEMLVRIKAAGGYHFRIVTSPLTEWPSQQEEFHQIVGRAMERAGVPTWQE